MAVTEEVRLEQPRAGGERTGPDPPAPRDEPEERAGRDAEGEHRPEPGARQHRPAGGEHVAKETQERVKGRVAVRLVACERPEPGDHARIENEVEPRRDHRAARGWDTERLHQFVDGRLPLVGESGRVAKRAEPEPEPRLAAERVSFVPDDRKPRLGRDHEGQGRQYDDQPGPSGQRSSRRHALSGG